MALSKKKKTITIALALADDRLLSRAARERGVSRSELIRQHVARALEQYRRSPKPTSAGIVRALTERGEPIQLLERFADVTNWTKGARALTYKRTCPVFQGL
jgi:hypothetical protein